MSSLPESSAAAYLAALNDPLFRQIKDTYSFFKQPIGTKGKNITPEELAAYNEAYAAILRAERGPALVAQVWDDLSQPQRELLLELLLKQYCDSRADPENKTLPLSFPQMRIYVGHPKAEAEQRGVPARDLDPFRHLDTLLDLLVMLYSAPIDGREHLAFQHLRLDVNAARRHLARAKSTTPQLAERAQGPLDAAQARLEERLSHANAARVVRLQQVKAVFSLLHANAALVPARGFANADQHAAVEVYFSHLDPGQQDAAVARVRDFLFAACEERAVRGEALDPDEHLVEILHALHAYDLGHALCAAGLKSIVRFVESRGAPPAFVEPFQDVVDQFCGDVWAHRFPRLAPSQQLYAVNMVRELLGRIHTLKPRQVINELAVILPMNSSSPTSWKHAHEADDPPAVLHSLARSISTRRAPSDANSTGSSTSSRYFPQATSARW